MSQRKNYFIAKGMQSKFAGTILLLTFLIGVITICNLYVLATFYMTNNATGVEQQTVVGLFSATFSEMWPRLLLLVLVNVIIVFIVSIMYSHQIAGPAYKLEKSLNRIADGDLTLEIHLRKNDNLKEVASAINRMLFRFRETMAKAKTLSVDISRKMAAVGDDDRFRVLNQSATELNQLIAQFKLEPDTTAPSSQAGAGDRN